MWENIYGAIFGRGAIQDIPFIGGPDEIYTNLFGRLAVILAFLFFFRKSKLFSTMMLKKETTLREKAVLCLLFTIIGIHGTYGFPVAENLVANTRAVGAIVAGLVGGPGVGLGAGLLIGLHRYSLGGFTINAALASAVLQGLLAGLYSKRLKNRKVAWPEAFMLGIALEVFHMAIIVINGPFDRAVEAVKIIGPPMTIANAVGVGLFIAFLEDVYAEQKKIQASATQLAFEIATKILPFMRRGLSNLSAGNASLVIGRMVESVDAVAFASKERLLALSRRQDADYVLDDNQAPLGRVTADRLAAGNATVLNVRTEVEEMFPGFPYGSAVITPLQESETVVGALVLFKMKEYGISAFEVELANGLHHLISTQIEISRADAQTELVAQAEINALQAQINPHFLFNALNTIVYYCLKQPETASELIVHLANFYRRNLANPHRMVSIGTEIAHVQSYVEIEAARFKGKLRVIYDIDKESRWLVPPLILQPLVENAIKHGILPKGEGGTITISSTSADGIFYVTVADDGVGMSREAAVKALEHDPDRKRIGLNNVNSRLKNIYGNNYGLIIESAPGAGTRVTLPVGAPRKGAEEAIHDTGTGG